MFNKPRNHQRITLSKIPFLCIPEKYIKIQQALAATCVLCVTRTLVVPSHSLWEAVYFNVTQSQWPVVKCNTVQRAMIVIAFTNNIFVNLTVSWDTDNC